MKTMQSRVEPTVESRTVEPSDRLAPTPHTHNTFLVDDDSEPTAGDQLRPDPQVKQQPVRRRFRAEYKLRILEEADKCITPGQIGALLRREGLYSSHLVTWRRGRKEASLKALAAVKRGRKAPPRSPLSDEVEKLQRENQLLRDRLSQAETIIEVQKKVSLLLPSILPQSSGRS